MHFYLFFCAIFSKAESTLLLILELFACLPAIIPYHLEPCRLPGAKLANCSNCFALHTLQTWSIFSRLLITDPNNATSLSLSFLARPLPNFCLSLIRSRRSSKGLNLIELNQDSEKLSGFAKRWTDAEGGVHKRLLKQLSNNSWKSCPTNLEHNEYEGGPAGQFVRRISFAS